ncbi:MAG: heme-binding protein [Paracoccaceae bacterium]
MKLKHSLTLDLASRIVDQALSTGRAHGFLPLSVVVLDAGGRIVASKSEDGSGIMRHDVALGKAWGALGMGISSRQIRDRLAARPTFVTALSTVSQGRLVPVPGGVLIEDEDGATIGAVGISGDTSEKDEFRAIAGILAAGLRSDPDEPDPDWASSRLSDTEE